VFKYVGDISKIAQNIINTYSEARHIAVDCTLGNGFDCDFLSERFKKVYAFDIQEEAIDNYKKRNMANVTLIHDSHENVKQYIQEEIDVAMYNLGFLPGGDKSITTKSHSSLKSINASLELLKSGGFVTIAVYVGHAEGQKESEALLKFVTSLPKNTFGVMIHSFANRDPKAPYLIIIEKK